MSWLSHAFKRLKHYADPRTAFKAQVHLTERAAHFTQRSVEQQVRALEGAGHFAERQARKDYIKFNRVTAYIAPVVTPILAFIGSLVPVIGLVLGPILALLGAVVARVSDSVALRSQGVTGHANSRRARGKQNRTLKYGLFGSAVGGLASLFGLSLAPADAAEAGLAGDAGALGSPGQTGVSAGPGGAGIGATAQNFPMVGAGGAPLLGASEGVNAASLGVGAGSGATFGAAAGAPAGSGVAVSVSSGILGTGITWGDLGKVVTTALQTALKALGIGQPKPAVAPGGSQLGGVGSSGGGTEGTGDTAGGPLDALGQDLAGLPLPIKLGAAALGLGVVVMAFSQGRKAA